MDTLVVIGFVVIAVWLLAPKKTAGHHQGHRPHRCGRWCRCRWFR